MNNNVQYKLTQSYLYVRNNPDIPFRYANRSLNLVGMHGDYGIFTHPDRKKPFVIAMADVTRV